MAESLIHNFFQADLRQFEDTMPQWLKDKEYYENSYHFCSSHPTDAFSKLDFENNFVAQSNGGNIVYSELSTAKNNTAAILELIEYAYDLGNIQYQGFNVGADKCYACGYEGDIRMVNDAYTCPQCGNTDKRSMNVIKRLCGYLAECNKRGSSKGRAKEMSSRVDHVNLNDATLKPTDVPEKENIEE